MNSGDLLNNESIARKNLTIFFLIDVSRSMRGSKIRTVNKVMHDVMPQIRDIGGSDAVIKVAAMSFSNDCIWMNPEPVPIEYFDWIDLQAGGWTSLGAACLELDRVMSRSEFLKSPSLSFAPVVILLSDGGPTDKYEDALFHLNRNQWFKHSIKIAFSVGSKSKPEKLALFTGDPDAVIKVGNSESLAKLVKLVTIRSSEICSTNSPICDLDTDADNKKQDLMIQEIKNMIDPLDLDLDEGW